MKKLFLFFIACASLSSIRAQTFPNVDSVKKFVNDSIRSNAALKATTLRKAYEGSTKFLPQSIQDTSSVSPKAHGMYYFQRKDSTLYVFDTIGGKKRFRLAIPVKDFSWGKSGNSGTVSGTNFIGTTDGQGLRFKVNAENAGFIDYINDNTFFGFLTGNMNSSGIRNVAMGTNALQINVSSTENTAIGHNALNLSTAGFNTAIGAYSFSSNTTGYSNVGIGKNSGLVNTTGFQNFFGGPGAGENNTTGQENTFVGYDAGLNNTKGFRNFYGGWNAKGGAFGFQNVVIGYTGGASLTNDSATAARNNIFIGYASGFNGSQLTTASNTVAIGVNSFTTANNQVVIGNTSMTQFNFWGALMPAGSAGTTGQGLISQGANTSPIWTTVVTGVSGTANQIASTGGATPVLSLVSGGVLPGAWALGTPVSMTATNVTGLPEGGLSLTDISTNNTSTTKHGFFPKLTSNRVYYVDNSGALVALALGGNGTVLTSTGATSAPVFNTPSTNIVMSSNIVGGAAGGILHESNGNQLVQSTDLAYDLTGGLGNGLFNLGFNGSSYIKASEAVGGVGILAEPTTNALEVGGVVKVNELVINDNSDGNLKWTTGGGSMILRPQGLSDDRLINLPDGDGTVAIFADASLPILQSGTYTPTLTNSTNISASTAFACQYMRVGNTVTVSGRVDIDVTTASTSSILRMTLPVNTAFTAREQAGGTASTYSFSGDVIAIRGNQSSSAYVEFIWIANADATNHAYHFSFTYQLLY